MEGIWKTESNSKHVNTSTMIVQPWAMIHGLWPMAMTTSTTKIITMIMVKQTIKNCGVEKGVQSLGDFHSS